MKNEDKSVLELLNAYANAERQIQSAANNRRITVKQYQKQLNDTVSRAISVLDEKNRKFADESLPTGFSEGQKRADGHTPQKHGGMSAKQAAAVLSRAGFRYNAMAFGYDTYIELHNATKAAGDGFKERVNKTIKQLKKDGKDTIYNVTQAVKEDIQRQGLLNVEYKGGRKVSVSSYAAMAARTARMESVNIGAFGRALENGTDYVRCTTIWPTCEICAKYQGKIYCISGKDKRFPALFKTALRHGYATMHPHCRHEFIPVWLELMDEKELAEAIEHSKISPKADTRSEEEREAYAEWQAEHRQRYNEQQYFDRAKQTLGSAMPYKDIGAFRRSYRSKEGSFAHQRSHNLIRDYKQLQSYREELGRTSLPKTLENYQKIVYNKSTKENFDHYIDARRKGSISAVASFSDWQETNTRLKSTFIGQSVPNGIKITNVSKHFVDRVIGSIYQRRSGVSLADLERALKEGQVLPVETRKDGKSSQKIVLYGVCEFTINPKTGELIQCNPRRLGSQKSK